MDATYVKRNCSNSKIIKIGGIVESSYYRVPSDGRYFKALIYWLWISIND